ncbi:beta family protein [Cribrihabitans pelagius]|uniref:beta family protein n=1 Tax=Cribrihabitans pelagius TaxID=1765746 RepID=UPI003B5A66A2
MDRIHEVYPDRPYFLDIDPFYDKEAKRPAQHDYYALIEDETKQSWVEFFDEYPNAFPCIQVNRADSAAIQNQIDGFTAREKIFLVRLDHGNGRGFSDVIHTVCNVGHSNFGFVLDAGWSRDLLSRTNWIDGLVKQIVDLRGDDIPIIVTGSSFPDSFTEYSLGDEVEVAERLLFSQLQRANNRARLIYGDWASSRSPSEGGGGAVIPPGIDLATERSWEIYRSEDDAPEFSDLAQEVMASPNYPTGLAIWATYMIASTALGDPNGITTLRRATAVRINMHLYRQLNFGRFEPAPDTDDDYQE